MSSVITFEEAADHVRKKGHHYSYATKLRLYALYKQATVGSVNTT